MNTAAQGTFSFLFNLGLNPEKGASHNQVGLPTPVNLIEKLPDKVQKVISALTGFVCQQTRAIREEEVSIEEMLL